MCIIKMFFKRDLDIYLFFYVWIYISNFHSSVVQHLAEFIAMLQKPGVLNAWD